MTLIEFLKSEVSNDTRIGTLANDVIGDVEFPYNKPEAEIISYLDFKLNRMNNGEVLSELLSAYHKQKESLTEVLNIDARFTPLRAEQWSHIKETFQSDRAIIVGEPGKIYRVYGVDTKRQEAIRFDIFTTRQLSDINILDSKSIYIGDLTREVPIQEALDLLAENKHDESHQPAEPNYSEMVDYLKKQIK